MDYKMKYDFGKHYEIKPFNCYMDDNDVAGGTFSALAKQIYVKAMDHFEDKIVEEIIKIASENNVTDVVLLDKAKIVQALKKATPVKVTHVGDEAIMCPICSRMTTNNNARYCDNCGQHFVPAWVVNSND